MSTIIDISKENEASHNHEKQNTLFFVSNVWYSIAKYIEQHEKKVIYSIKVGIALILVSLIYLLDPLYKRVGESSIWAIMTVVVIYDFYAGWSSVRSSTFKFDYFVILIACKVVNF